MMSLYSYHCVVFTEAKSGSFSKCSIAIYISRYITYNTNQRRLHITETTMTVPRIDAQQRLLLNNGYCPTAATTSIQFWLHTVHHQSTGFKALTMQGLP